MTKLPTTYTAIEIAQEQTNVVKAMLSLQPTTKNLREPEPNELLIQMEASPINPSDIAFLQGSYRVKKTMPTVPGFEGCGIIKAVGQSLDDEKWVGKRVSCFTQKNKDGCWANYFYAKPQEVILIDENLNAEQAATFFINPFTAWGLCEIALQRESKTIVINAAGSMVAAFMFELATMHQIEVIGIVRKQATADQLIASGWKNVLVESDANFIHELKILSENLAANTAFDAIAGPSAGLLLNALPPDSEVVVYGGLSNKPIADINPLGLIFDNKMITGFNLNDWMAETDSITFEVARNTLTEIIVSGKVKNKVQAAYPLTEIREAMKAYLSNMSAGKVLLSF
jgi:NADPH:quinone reductase